MANYGWILQGWGNKGLWALSGAAWEIWLAQYDALKITAQGGYGEREFDDTYNVNWEFKISFTVSVGEVEIADVLFFLDGDTKPIIFRYAYNVPDNYITFSIIYDGVVKDSYAVLIGEAPDYKIYRKGSIYYFTGSDISFNYGSLKRVVKLKLIGTQFHGSKMYWLGKELPDEYLLKWYYTESTSEITEGYAFIM